MAMAASENMRSELDLEQVPHLRAPFALEKSEAPRLDYHSLGGLGLERLCFHLLLAEGYAPRYFGRSGQWQGGVDLLVQDGVRHRVYQCKNLADWDFGKLKAALEDLRTGWLVTSGLEVPEVFVVCCPLELRDGKTDQSWKALVHELTQATRVPVELWHKEILDAKLKERPDIVADLFSDLVAEQFCSLPDWKQDLFRPLLPGSGEKRTIGPYLEMKERDQLVFSEELEDQFAAILVDQPVAFLLGPSGSGKTMAALALAEGLAGGAWRVFFVNFRHELTVGDLVAGIKRRASRPTLFVFDDCHFALDKVEQTLDRVSALNLGGRVRFVVTAQDAQRDPGGPQEVESELLEEAEASGQVLRLRATLELYGAILTRRGFSLAKPDLERLFAVTAQDLKLLGIALDSVADSEALRGLNEKTFFDAALIQYFGGRSITEPDLKRAAALAQFDLELPVAEVPWATSTKLPTGLAAIVGQPPALVFIHASAAEVVYRALCQSGQMKWEQVELELIGELTKFVAERLERREAGWGADLLKIQRHHLRLVDASSLKSRVFCSLVENLKKVHDILPQELLRLLAHGARGEKDLPFGQWVAERIEKSVEDFEQGSQIDALANLGGLWRAAAIDEKARVWLEARLSPERLAKVLGNGGTVQDLLWILVGLESAIAGQLITLFNSAWLNLLFQRTIEQGRSIGTLHLAMRELAKRPDPDDPERTLLDRLETLCGPEVFLRLLDARGTVFELFSILRNSSPKAAARLLEHLNSPRVERLVQRTIDQGRSIGTLSLAMRDLAKRPAPDDARATLLDRLEAVCGPELFLRLFDARGTVYELFRILEYSTPKVSARLLEHLDSPRIERLVQRTIDQGRSIGTLNLAMRELAKRPAPDDPAATLLDRLEAVCGPELLLRLLDARGTVFELFMILRDSTPKAAADLLEHLDSPRVERLVQRTIDQGRSIGTLSLALRDLAKRPIGGTTQARQLEGKFTAAQWWKLVEGVGDLGSLGWLLQGLSGQARRELLKEPKALERPTWETLSNRGDFYDLCSFATLEIEDASEEVLDLLRTLYPELAAENLERQDWSTISSGAARLRDIGDPWLRESLHEVLRKFLLKIEPEALQFNGIEPAVGTWMLLWRERPEFRPRLATAFATVWPPARHWEKPEYPIVGGGLVLHLAGRLDLPDHTSHELVEHWSTMRQDKKIDKTNDRPLALFLWNRFALWFDKLRTEDVAFEALISEELRKSLLQRITKRTGLARSNRDKLALAALAGVIAFLEPENRAANAGSLRGRVKGVPYLLEETDGLDFVEAFFALEGLSLLCPVRAAFSPERCAELLEMAEELDFRGAAIELLCQAIRERRAGRVGTGWRSLSLDSSSIVPTGDS